jgi:hypothetical protein
LSGIVIGLFLAFAVLPLVRWFFPALEEWSIDRGMRLNEALHPVGPTATERGLGIRGYLLIDVDEGDESTLEVAGDAGPATSSERSCDVVQVLAAAPGDSSNQPRWDCAPWRPLNRFMLTAIVEYLRARGVKLIVVDADLHAGGYPLPADESNALMSSLRKPGSTALAVIPAQPLAVALPGDEVSIAIHPAALGLTLDQALSVGAPAIPYPGDRLRRYVRCYGLHTGSGARAIASIATRAAALLEHVDDPSRLCRGAGEINDEDRSPRIFFTLPSLPAEPSTDAVGRAGSVWSRYHLFFDRCRAVDLGDRDSACSQSDLFRDKVVVIGATSRARGDRHLTPLGEMAGAEVVLNAIRSALVGERRADRSVPAQFGHDLAVCGKAACVWFVAFSLLGVIAQRKMAEVATFFLRFAVVLCTLTLVLWIGIKGSFSLTDSTQNLDLMLPVLAFGLELYTNAARYLEQRIERPINHLLQRLGLREIHPHPQRPPGAPS